MESSSVFSTLFPWVVGLEFRDSNETWLLTLAYFAVIVTCIIGMLIAAHHRQRQKEKFEIICKFEKELEIDKLIKPITDKSQKTIAGSINTASFIIIIQLAIVAISVVMLLKKMKIF